MKMKKSQLRRPVRIGFSCTIEEYQAIMTLAQQTTTRNLSSYARNMVLGKPAVFSSHNHSLDAVVDCMGGLRGQLERLMERPDLGAMERSQLAELMREINAVANKILASCMPK